jgi:hypothetical protein
MPKQVAYEPMTLGNMRRHGMTRLDVSCHGPDCWHRALVDVSTYADDVIVAELGRRFRCSACGSRNIDARPDWVQYARALSRSVSRAALQLRAERVTREHPPGSDLSQEVTRGPGCPRIYHTVPDVAPWCDVGLGRGQGAWHRRASYSTR